MEFGQLDAGKPGLPYLPRGAASLASIPLLRTLMTSLEGVPRMAVLAAGVARQHDGTVFAPVTWDRVGLIRRGILMMMPGGGGGQVRRASCTAADRG